MAAEQHFLREDRDGIVKITFNRPAKRNAIDTEMFEGLAAAVTDLGARRDLRVLLICGAGDYFSSGMDLALVAAADPQGSGITFRHHYRANARHTLYDEMEALEKPIVVVHHAPCFGGGLELSLSCDFRLAGASARYQMPEINMGMIAGSGGTSRLTRLVGPHWARWLLMAAEPIDAQQALAMGLVHKVYPDTELQEGAWAFCQKLAAFPPEALAISKLSIELVADLDRAQARNIERMANSVLFFGDEHKERMAQFMSRHPSAKPKG